MNIHTYIHILVTENFLHMGYKNPTSFHLKGLPLTSVPADKGVRDIGKEYLFLKSLAPGWYSHDSLKSHWHEPVTWSYLAAKGASNILLTGSCLLDTTFCYRKESTNFGLLVISAII